MIAKLAKHPISSVIVGFSVVAGLISFGFLWGSQQDNAVATIESTDSSLEQTESNEVLSPNTQNTTDPVGADDQVEPTETDKNETVFLEDLQPVESENVAFRNGSIGFEITGEILFLDGEENLSSVEYRLDREYQTLSATIGFDDNSSSSSRQSILIEDESGNELLPWTPFELGDFQEVNIDVSDVARLIIRTGFFEDEEGQEVVDYEGSIGIASGMLIPK